MFRAKQVFLKCFFYDNTMEYYHDSQNIVVILAPGRAFFSAACAQFPSTFME